MSAPFKTDDVCGYGGVLMLRKHCSITQTLSSSLTRKAYSSAKSISTSCRISK